MKGMTTIVKTVSGWVKILIFLFGIYIVLFGHLTPGGGFAGGVILASSYVLIMLAFGRESVESYMPMPLASKLDCVGALMFIAIALFGFFYGAASFFWNYVQNTIYATKQSTFDLLSAGTIPLSNIAIGLKVGASLFLVIFILSIYRPSVSQKNEE